MVWGVALFAIALVARNWGSVLQAGLSIASILYGSLLGVFLLGLLTKRTGEVAAMTGMSAGLLVMLWVKFFTRYRLDLVRADRHLRDVRYRVFDSTFHRRNSQRNSWIMSAFSEKTEAARGRRRRCAPCPAYRLLAVAIVIGTVIGSGIFLVPKT